MARPTKPKALTEVTAYDHDDTRRNIPTADAAATFYDEQKDALPPLRYQRNPDLDPQLVWKGKDAQDSEDLVVDAPPIYIQEKIAPQALIENLKRESAKRRSVTGAQDEMPALFDFEDFDTLDELAQVEFYQHEESWKNRMILGDSLQVMGSLAEREALRGKVQMIYIDPPYGIKFGSNWQVRTSKRDVKDGKLDDAAREAEQIKAFRDTWELGIHSYLSYLRDRFVAARDLLTESGSVFVQIGDENVHLVRSLLDEVFGRENFCAQIAYKTTTGAGSPGVTTEVLAGVSDYLVWYAKDRSEVKYRTIFAPRSITEDANYRYVEDEGGIRSLTKDERANIGTLYRDGARILRQNPLTSQTAGQTTIFPVDFQGQTYAPGKGGWKTNAAGMENLRRAGRLMPSGQTLGFVRYFADFPFQIFSNAWDDTRQSGFGESKAYVVQTATKVIERCVLLTTDPGDLVLDPTCGSGTTAFVAERWGRRWITIDTSRVALALARQRIIGSKYPYFTLADSDEGRKAEGLPSATTANDLRHGFVYKKVQHVTLKSIANNPDIRENMTRDEIDAAIKKHADFELLYDQPLEEKSKVRVAGPFTVESLSPHRSLSLDDADDLRPGAVDVDQPSFEQSILANLRAAGIQNGRKSERMTFSALEMHPGVHVQALGNQADADEPVAIAIGPQYGTVSAGFVKAAAKEAIDAGVPLVAVLGFSFDPNLGVETDEEGFAVVGGVRDLGRVKVLIVRMNVDLLMGEELKKTGSGNLFTVFGEPDLSVEATGDGNWTVEVHGVDVYDPTSGEVRSNSTSEIALWMVDTNYDGESFFVRHAYFLGDKDPYKSLKTALKSDIDAEAWATLNRAKSIPFETPSTGKIAVKVINDYGDEVMKVLEVR